MIKKKIKNLEELKQISFDLVKEFKIPQVVLLKGDMAAGKTQMARYMIQSLGFKENTVHSPTFSIINFYKKAQLIDSSSFDSVVSLQNLRPGESQTAGGKLAGLKGIYHVDLYRIKQEKELEDIAFWDIFYDPAVVFIEWPQIVEKKLPLLWNKLVIQLEFSQKPNSRILKWQKYKV